MQTSPQILRTRLAAFKTELSDDMFRQLPCASCCRLKRKFKLTRVVSPPPDSDALPTWLPWGQSDWLKHREGWYIDLNKLLSADNYLTLFLQNDVRESAATAGARQGSTPFASVAAAESWLLRVEQWSPRLQQDLYTDCVPAPGDLRGRWMLHRCSDTVISTAGGAISCNLCNCCRLALGQAPEPQMPDVARANGLWHGPDPEEMSELSYCEAKVINLARIYVSV